MKAINVGNEFRIYDESLKVFDTLPAQTYSLRFNKQSGFYLEAHRDFSIGEKVYGVHNDKVNKVLKSFEQFDRNLGVILSGDKGIGKSLFAKMLSSVAVKTGLPVIIADTYIPGIASYLESIEQEIVVLFDEFDKTFGKADRDDGARLDPQTEMLTLFDGVTVGKKLFVITCNELRALNDYLVNRPGRFHYHFRFDYPTPEEIREYLTDKLCEEHYGEIDKVISFSRRVDLNYDCLRAIAFELNTGASFESAIMDLNIINLNESKYNVTLLYPDGSELSSRSVSIDLFNRDHDACFWLHGPDGGYILRVDFCVGDCFYDQSVGATCVDAENIRFHYDDDDDDEVKRFKAMRASRLVIVRARDRSINYNLAC